MGSLISDQQTSGYGQHQWHQQSASTPHSIMTNQTFHDLQSNTNQNNFHAMSNTNQHIPMMQHQSQPVHHQIQQTAVPEIVTNAHQQMNHAGNNYIGPTSSTPPHVASLNSNENGSTSDDSDDNAINDPNVSRFLIND